MSVRDRLVKGAQPHVPSDENVVNAVSGLAGPWVLAFGALGASFAKPRAVILTDKHIYIMKMKGMNKLSEVETKYPVGSVRVSSGKGVANVPLTIGTEYQLWISKLWRKEAESLAANAS